MKPAPFEYFAPTTLAETCATLAEHADDAKLLAGGQSLIPAMNFRLGQPAALIDLNHLHELAYIRESEGGGLRIGALTRQAEVADSELAKARAPLLYETMPFIAHPQIRNRGTIGGSLAHADPAAELPAVMTAVGARFRLQRQDGERWVEAADFFTGMFLTALEPEEILTDIELPPTPTGHGWAFREVSRRHGDYALVGLAVSLTVDERRRCTGANLCFLSVGEGPVIARGAADLLVGETLSPELLEAAAETAATVDIDPGDDIHASADFRRHLARSLVRSTVQQAYDRAGH